jgi:L-ribulose-5-phosphate 3-epimerase
MRIHDHDIAVCSWSLRPKSMRELVQVVRDLGLQHIQLGLLELIQADDAKRKRDLDELRNSGIGFTGGMMSFPGEDYSTIDAICHSGGFAPDKLWDERKSLCQKAAPLARELGMNQIGTHIGFVPCKAEVGYQRMIDRVMQIADCFAEKKIDLLMETGQERADELLEFLHDLNAPTVHINFDPANMILYGAGDPIAAVHTLGKHIRHVHVKDANGSATPRVAWGVEVPFGTGQVGPSAFLSALHQNGYAGPLAIEREAGDDRAGDVKYAIATLTAALVS